MSNQYGVVVANITESTEPFWMEFRAVARSLGVTNTKALEQAARLWIDERKQDDGSVRIPNPFA